MDTERAPSGARYAFALKRAKIGHTAARLAASESAQKSTDPSTSRVTPGRVSQTNGKVMRDLAALWTVYQAAFTAHRCCTAPRECRGPAPVSKSLNGASKVYAPAPFLFALIKAIARRSEEVITFGLGRLRRLLRPPEPLTPLRATIFDK